MNKEFVFDNTKKYKILLLTHISADNLGDQMIELCSNALVRTVMKNLNIDDYQLISIDASMVNNRYLSVHLEDRTSVVDTLIKDCDLVIFGGSPIFNYTYEGFSERTVKTLGIINKYSKPVIFSSIGIEKYDPSNTKCMRLKKSLMSSNIKMITTRDNYDALTKLTDGTLIKIDKVADPAVYSSMVMKSYYSKELPLDHKKIGLFIIRGNAFLDNGIDLDKEASIVMWKDIISELESRGYDYELLTSGFHIDEAFLDELTMSYGFKGSKCVTCLNTPEELIEKLSEYAGVISCRLHPSIISYSMKVPSVGLIWNDKVSLFYDNIGYRERAIEKGDFKSSIIVDKLEKAINEGVKHDTVFLMSVYKNLFAGIKASLGINNETESYDYEALVNNMQPYQGSDYKEKIRYKLAREYHTMNAASKFREEVRALRAEKLELVKKINALYQNSGSYAGIDKEIHEQEFALFYNIQKKDSGLSPFSKTTDKDGTVFERKASYELKAHSLLKNNGTSTFSEVLAIPKEGLVFEGYRLRASVSGYNYILLENGQWKPSTQYNAEKDAKFALFQPGDMIPVVDLNYVSALVVVMIWKNK